MSKKVGLTAFGLGATTCLFGVVAVMVPLPAGQRARGPRSAHLSEEPTRVSDGQNCPHLQAQVNYLTVQLNRALALVRWLKERLGALTSAVLNVLALLGEQAEKPTMPRGRLLGQVQALDRRDRRTEPEVTS